MPKSNLTPERLRELLHYEPETGILTWKERRRGITQNAEIGYKDSHGYRSATIARKPYKAHRLAWFYMTGTWPIQIDHINHIRDDNRWCNLREVISTKEQNQNLSLRRDNASGYHGVYWDYKNLSWQVTLSTKYLGRFKTKEQAIAARKAAEITHGFHPNHGQ